MSQVKTYLFFTIFCLVFVFNCISSVDAVQIDLTGQVSNVLDGNTFTINQGSVTIRLADIQAPGVYQRGYDQSKSILSDLIIGKTVYVDQSSVGGVVDGRLICVVYIDFDSQNYLNVNKKVLESTYFTSVDDRNDFNPAQWTLLVQKEGKPPPVNYSLLIQTPEGSGSTNPASGSYRYYQVVTVPVQANPSGGWILDHWVLDGSNIGNNNPYIVNMNTDHQLKAVFTQSQDTSPPPSIYRLEVVGLEGSGTTNPFPGTYTYYQVVYIDLNASPSAGWQFDHWIMDGVDIGGTNPIEVKINSDHTIKAVFVAIPIYYALIVELPSGSGSTDPSEGTNDYQQQVSVSMKATPASGWVLKHWILDGKFAGDANPYEIIMNMDHSIKAVFEIAQSSCTLDIESSEGSSSTEPTPGRYFYQQPVRVSIKAVSGSGRVFDHWMLDGSNVGNSNPCTVVMNTNHRIKAVFVTGGGGESSNGVPGYPWGAILIGVVVSLIMIISFLHTPKFARVRQ
jgi:hypothetical protein